MEKISFTHRDAPAPRLQTSGALLPAPAVRPNLPGPAGQRLRVVVVGGSIAGLCTAAALHRIGCQVEVLERSADLSRVVGGGIVAQPDFIKFLTQFTNVDPAAILVESRGRQTYNQEGQLVVRDPSRQQFTAWDTVWRALRAALPADVTYHSGTQVVSLQQQQQQRQDGDQAQQEQQQQWQDGDQAQQGQRDQQQQQHVGVAGGRAGVLACGPTIVTGSCGRRWEADLLVGADGPGSFVRLQLLPGVQSGYAGYIAWRGFMEEAHVPPDVLQAVDGQFTVVQVPRSHILAYVIPGQGGELTPGKRRLNWVWYVNYEELALGEVLVDREGKRRSYSMPHGQLSPTVEQGVRSLAATTLPDPFSRMVDATPHIFAQSVHDLEVPRMVLQGTITTTATTTTTTATTTTTTATTTTASGAGGSGSTGSSGGGGSGSIGRSGGIGSIGSNDGGASMSSGCCCLVGDAAFIARPHTAAGTTKAAVNAWQLASALTRHGANLQVALPEYEEAALQLGRQLHELGVAIGIRSQFPERAL